MNDYKAEVNVRLKSGILDPQGKAIQHALEALGFSSVGDVRTGKLIEFEIRAEDDESANAQIDKACRQLLANPVIEDFSFELTKRENGNG